MHVLPTVLKASSVLVVAFTLAGCAKAMTMEEIKAACEKDAAARGPDAVAKCIEDTKLQQDSWIWRLGRPLRGF